MNDEPKRHATPDPAEVVAQAAAQAREQLRPILDEITAQISEDGVFSAPAESWAWLARAGRSHS